MVTKRQIVRIVFYVSMIIIILHMINGCIVEWNRIVNSSELCDKNFGVQMIAFIPKLYEGFWQYYILAVIIVLISVPVATILYMVYSVVCVFSNREIKNSIVAFLKLFVSVHLTVYDIYLIYMSVK